MEKKKKNNKKSASTTTADRICCCCELHLDYPYQMLTLRAEISARGRPLAMAMPRTMYNMLRKCLNNGGQCQCTHNEQMCVGTMLACTNTEWQDEPEDDSASSMLSWAKQMALAMSSISCSSCSLSQRIASIGISISKNDSIIMEAARRRVRNRGRALYVLIMASGDDYTIFIYRNYYHLWYQPPSCLFFSSSTASSRPPLSPSFGNRDSCFLDWSSQPIVWPGYAKYKRQASNNC